MSFKTFVFWMIMKIQPKRRQRLKERLLSRIRESVDDAIDIGTTNPNPLPMSDIKAISLSAASRSLTGPLRIVGVTGEEMADIITEIFNARSGEVG